MKIASINTDQNLYQRLMDIGFTKGADITYLYKFGTSLAFKIKNTLIGLRMEDAQKIIVEESQNAKF